jgi:hypothetical protein
MLEPDAGKLARPVLWGGGDGNAAPLPDRTSPHSAWKPRAVLLAKRHIDIMYFSAFTKGLPGAPEYVAWMKDVRGAIADLGWSVTAQGPTCSSTSVDEDYLAIESDGGALDLAVLKDALERIGISPTYYTGDIEGGFCWA